MISAEQLTAAGIAIPSNDATGVLYAAAALDWLDEHTKLQFDKADAASIAALPASAKLFVVKFSETMQRRAGVTSQSIEGLSLSFDTGASADVFIWTLARSLLGNYLKSQVRVTPARRRW